MQSARMTLDIDLRNVSGSGNVPVHGLTLIPQGNGVWRIHGENGGYLFSIVRHAEDFNVYAFQEGFGKSSEPTKIWDSRTDAFGGVE